MSVSLIVPSAVLTLSGPTRTEPAGSIRIPCPGGITIERGDRYREFLTETGSVPLPAGEYHVVRVALRRTDAAGRQWNAEATSARCRGQRRARTAGCVSRRRGTAARSRRAALAWNGRRRHRP